MNTKLNWVFTLFDFFTIKFLFSNFHNFTIKLIIFLISDWVLSFSLNIVKVMCQMSASLHNLYQDIDFFIWATCLKITLHLLSLGVWKHAFSSNIIKRSIYVLQIENKCRWLGTSSIHFNKTVQKELELQFQFVWLCNRRLFDFVYFQGIMNRFWCLYLARMRLSFHLPFFGYSRTITFDLIFGLILLVQDLNALIFILFRLLRDLSNRLILFHLNFFHFLNPHLIQSLEMNGVIGKILHIAISANIIELVQRRFILLLRGHGFKGFIQHLLYQDHHVIGGHFLVQLVLLLCQIELVQFWIWQNVRVQLQTVHMRNKSMLFVLGFQNWWDILDRWTKRKNWRSEQCSLQRSH